MAQSLSNIASPDIKQPFGPQYTALTGKKPKVPLSSIIHAKIPGYMYSHEARLEREFAQEAHEEEMELAEKEMTEAEKQAEKATAIQATGIGGGLGYMMMGTGAGAAYGAGVVGLEFAKDPLEEWAEQQAGSTGEAAMGIAVRAGQGYMLGGPWGAAIGAGVGVVEEIAEATMLCTELHRQGLLPDEIYRADCDYAKTLPSDTVSGYRAWAKYLVPVMAKSRLFTKFVGIFVRAWAYHAAHKAGLVPEGNRFGALIEMVGTPICRIIGRIVFQKEAKLMFVNFS